MSDGPPPAVIARLDGLRDLLEERTSRIVDLTAELKQVRDALGIVERQLMQQVSALTQSDVTIRSDAALARQNITRLDENQSDMGKRLRHVEDQQTRWKAQMAMAALILVPFTSVSTAVASALIG